MRKEIGKIQKVRFGMGGYDGAMIGISFTLGSEKECWGVGDFWGDWALERSKDAKWTEADRIKNLGEMVMKINDLMKKAKVENVNDLVDVPVEVTFQGNVRVGWRILEEVI